ncbi:MAG: SRPBCC domain-containing protein [Propionibacteriaceae bacterium]|nr:SRPBCC domain-containing protein [Propionibacteriaceae bacterium]
MSEQSEATGESLDTAVTVSRSVSKPLKSVWVTLMGPAGAEALLGPGGQITEKGHVWRAADGAHGVTRSFHPLEQIRFSWHKDDDDPASLVDVRLASEGEGTLLSITHEHLHEGADRQWLRQRWSEALERIDEATA